MNTDAKNCDDATGVTAHNSVHHSTKYPAASRRTGVVIVNDELVRRYFPSEPALGNRIRFVRADTTSSVEISGIVSNSTRRTLGENQRSAIYYPLEQRAGGMNISFVVLRSSADPAAGPDRHACEPSRRVARGVVDGYVSFRITE